MPCRWTARKNLRDYCGTCSYGTRLGCMVNGKPDRGSYTTSLRNADLPTGQQEIRIGKYVIKKSGRPIQDVLGYHPIKPRAIRIGGMIFPVSQESEA